MLFKIVALCTACVYKDICDCTVEALLSIIKILQADYASWRHLMLLFIRISSQDYPGTAREAQTALAHLGFRQQLCEVPVCEMSQDSLVFCWLPEISFREGKKKNLHCGSQRSKWKLVLTEPSMGIKINAPCHSTYNKDLKSGSKSARKACLLPIFFLFAPSHQNEWFLSIKTGLNKENIYNTWGVYNKIGLVNI